MKALKDFTQSEAAELLHQLFPDEMQDLMHFIHGMCLTIREDQEINRRNWNTPDYDFEFFLERLIQVEHAIDQDWTLLVLDASSFASLLFQDYRQLFSIHCLKQFVTLRQHPNPKFSIAVNLLFN